jgi:hypothetical protein
LHQITGSNSSNNKDDDDKEDTNNIGDESNDVVLFKATTQSIFGWQTKYVFDPLKDITPY